MNKQILDTEAHVQAGYALTRNLTAVQPNNLNERMLLNQIWNEWVCCQGLAVGGQVERFQCLNTKNDKVYMCSQ